MDYRPDLLAVTHQIGVDFLRSELAAALIFLEVARDSQVEQTVLRNEENAYVAYQAVVRFLGKVKLTEVQRQEVETRLAELKTRLQAVGYRF